MEPNKHDRDPREQDSDLPDPLIDPPKIERKEQKIVHGGWTREDIEETGPDGYRFESHTIIGPTGQRSHVGFIQEPQKKVARKKKQRLSIGEISIPDISTITIDLEDVE